MTAYPETVQNLEYSSPTLRRSISRYPVISMRQQSMTSSVGSEDLALDSASIDDTASSQNLCRSCCSLNIEELASPRGQPRAARIYESENCPLCTSIFAFDLRDRQQRTSIDTRLKLIRTVSDSGTTAMRLHILRGSDQIDTPIIVMTDSDDVAANTYDTPIYRALISSGSKETMDIIQNWLNHCLDNHTCSTAIPGLQDVNQCFNLVPGAMQSSNSPTRLLDLRAFSDRCLDVKLIEKLASGVRYATLSHCWGPNPEPEHQTMIKTLAQNKNSIPWVNLPTTYRDAISVCRRLQIRYLWIDSLCIVQDAPDDWKREVASMADVYGNSYLTISADWSMAPGGGCFKTRQQPSRLQQTSDSVFLVTNTLRGGSRSSLYFIAYYKPGHQHLNTTQLASRAWASQERLLSRRNIHFTEDQVFWECRCAFAGEDMVPRDPGELVPSYVFRLKSDSTEMRLHVWYTWVVQRFTSGELTRPTDRLPAISALAKTFHYYLQTPYLAGLWLEGLWYGLSWYRAPSETCQKKSREYLAPSWSWAAVNKSVDWLIQLPLHGTEKKAEIEDAEVKYDADPFGFALHGRLRIKGQLVKNISIRETERLTANMGIYQLKSSFLKIVYLDFANEPPLAQVDCLLLALDKTWNTQYFLLVSLVGIDDKITYQRVGMASRTPLARDEEWMEETIIII